MFPKAILSLSFIVLLAFAHVPPARAQFAVIDVASLTQLIQQYEMLQQQLATAQSHLAQAQSAYAAITGNRGMQNLLVGTPRNYLPTDWTQVSQVMSGSSGSYAALAGQVTTLVNANAVLTPAQMATFSATEQTQLTAARRAAALREVTARTALAQSSDRFNSLQQLIRAIGSANDEKASLDLAARISAEVGMLANEHTKLEVLKEVEASEEHARSQQLRERAVADQGSLRHLVPMGL